MSNPGEVPSSIVVSGLENLGPLHYQALVKNLGRMGLHVEPERFGDNPALFVERTDSGLVILLSHEGQPQDYGITYEDLEEVADQFNKPRMVSRLYKTLSWHGIRETSIEGKYFSYQRLKQALIPELGKSGNRRRIDFWPNTGEVFINMVETLIAKKTSQIEAEQQRSNV